MNSAKQLDHGELNVVGRTNTINADLDRYKKEQSKKAAVDRKSAAQENRLLKAKAKELFAVHSVAMIEKFKGKFGEKELANKFDQMVKWEPSKFIVIAERFAQEQVA